MMEKIQSYRLLATVFTMIICATALSAQNFTISQIDSARLLADGSLSIYLSFLPGEVPAGESSNISVFDITDGERQLEVLEINRDANVQEGVDFLLLMDNSGSMYDESISGRSRMAHAREAASAFISQIAGSPDRLGLFSFNTIVEELSPAGSGADSAARAMDLLIQPDTAMAYTELYAALTQAAGSFPSEPGRKAVIVLSDGENFPYFGQTRKPHPIWGERLYASRDAREAFLEEGVSLYAVNFGSRRDPELAQLVEASGGVMYDAANSQELAGVYKDIRSRIQAEYRLRVKAPSYRSSARELEVAIGGNGVRREYYVPLIFGEAGTGSLLMPLILLLAGLGLLIALYFLSFQGPVKKAQIQGIDGGATVALGADATVIGSSPTAAMTIAGSPAIAEDHATILRDEKTGTYTLVSKRQVRVNNNAVTRRKLEPGDVIKIEDSTIVFDAPEGK